MEVASSSWSGKGEKNIVEVAVAAGSFTTLVAAVKQAKLVEALSGAGPFTVFAPTDAAFTAAIAALKTTPADLLAREDLGSILQYHVVSGKVMAKDLADGQKVKPLMGAELVVSIKDGVVKVGEATVSTPDMECSNGVIHIIDAVLLPPAALQPIIETAVAA